MRTLLDRLDYAAVSLVDGLCQLVLQLSCVQLEFALERNPVLLDGNFEVVTEFISKVLYAERRTDSGIIALHVDLLFCFKTIFKLVEFLQSVFVPYDDVDVALVLDHLLNGDQILRGELLENLGKDIEPVQ